MLHAPVFDMYVNARSHSVKVLQRTLILFEMEITVDGVIGPSHDCRDTNGRPARARSFG